MKVGYLVGGKFACVACVKSPELITPLPVAVDSVHLGSYSQRCVICKEVVVKGPFTTELFPTPVEADEFRWTDMQMQILKFDNAMQDDDMEAAGHIRTALYRRILRADMKYRLFDKELIYVALEKIMMTDTRWGG